MGHIRYLLTFAYVVIPGILAQVPPASKVAIPLQVRVDRTASTLTLSWKHDSEYTGDYIVGRKERDAQFFQQLAVVQPSSSQLEWTDGTAIPGVLYEYTVRNSFTRTINNQRYTFVAAGYASTGIDPFMSPYRGRIVLVVDSSVVDSLSRELTQLRQDLYREGWKVSQTIVPRAEQYSPQAIRRTKDSIRAWYHRSGDEPASALLIGRVAVPYSGLYHQGQFITPPDGHPDHRGAWPCDGYYGCMDNEQGWTDLITDTAGVTRPENRNFPGDGKFDNVIFPAPLVIRIGRVDFYNLPVLTPQGATDRTAELSILRDYFARNHAYRTGQVQYSMSGLIDDNFVNYPELFARSAWISFPQLVSPAHVREEDWFPILDTTTRLLAYGCGAGSYSSAAGVTNSNELATKRIRSVFAMLFGSYFGDWDSRNNLMRVALARGALTCSWSGRPVWYLHPMAAGESIGDVSLTIQNLSPFQGQSTYVPSTAQGWIHVALLGDPTLRIRYGSVSPPTTLTARQESRRVVLQWESPSPRDSIVGFYLYRTLPGAEEEVLTQVPLLTTTYIDNFITEGHVRYAVRAVGRIPSPSGSFLDLSRPVTTELSLTSTEHEPEPRPIVQVSPNPANHLTRVRVYVPTPHYVTVRIIALDGRVVARLCDGFSSGELLTVWDASSVAPGFYAVVACIGDHTYIEPFIVQ